MSGNYYFVIVGRQDRPIFEQEFGPRAKQTGEKEDHRHLNQFIVHAALDVVDEQRRSTTHMNLKIVDTFNDWLVSAFITAGQTRLMLLHDLRHDDGIKSFFQDVHELYVKALMNPLFVPGEPIQSPEFLKKVKALAKKHL